MLDIDQNEPVPAEPRGDRSFNYAMAMACVLPGMLVMLVMLHILRRFPPAEG